MMMMMIVVDIVIVIVYDDDDDNNMKIGIAYVRASPSNFVPSFRVYVYIIHFII